jgi:hypothetical protein
MYDELSKLSLDPSHCGAKSERKPLRLLLGADGLYFQQDEPGVQFVIPWHRIEVGRPFAFLELDVHRGFSLAELAVRPEDFH